MKIAHSIFILLVSYFTFSQKTVNETQLTKSESKLFLQQELYSGMVFNQFGNNQVKSIYQVNLGLVKGKMIEYLFDIEFKNYQDTAELNKLNFQLTTKSNDLEAIIQDSINTYKLAIDYLNYEIGGNEKWIDLEIKNKEGKLKSKKKEIFDKYEQLVQSKNSANRILSEKRKAIREVNQKINKETQKKPSFIGKKSKEFEQVNFIAEGKAIIYDSLGNKFGEGNFIKGLQNGVWVYYFNNGAKHADVNYLNGNGGDLGKTGIPKNGREGLVNFYYKNGKLDNVSNYKAGKAEGVSNSFYENGNKKSVENYKAGELEGVHNTFYENGKPKQVSNLKDGKFDGLCTIYYENGKPEQVLNYKDGKFDGLCTFYYENGNKAEVSDYKAGKLEGVFNTFYENGNKKEVSNAKAGERDGLCTFYYENGKLKEVLNYKADKLDGQRTQYNDLGLKTSEIYYSNNRQNGKMTMYENGVKTNETQYVNGSLHGPMILYYENGKIKSKTTFDSTYLENSGIKGDYYRYNEDGTIKFHEFYNKDGTFKTIKAAGNDNLTNAELNKSYKCKCCKATINGLKNGINSEGNEFDIYAEEACKSNINFGTILGYSNCYDYFRNSVYKYCTLKCARTCY